MGSLQVVQLHEQRGALALRHSLPVAAGERALQRPQQVEAGLAPRLAHGLERADCAERAQLGGCVDACGPQHAFGRRAQVGQGAQRGFGFVGAQAGHGPHDGLDGWRRQARPCP